MKRNILKAGRSSLAISIPKYFVNDNRLYHGQELDVICHGPTMIVTCGVPSKYVKKLDLKNLGSNTDSKILDKILGALFKQGADTYELIISDTLLKEKVREIIRKGKLNMYEQPSGSLDNTIIIHSPIKNYDETTLEQMTAVIIKQIFVTLEEFVTLSSNKTLSKKIIEEMVARDKMINDHADICRRIINQTVLNYKSTAWYVFVDKCEKIGDLLKNVISWSDTHGDIVRKDIAQFENITNCLYALFSGATTFNIKKMDSFFNLCEISLKNIETCKNMYLYYYLKSMLVLIKDAYSDIIIRNI
jgi:hypothetical protein